MAPFPFSSPILPSPRVVASLLACLIATTPLAAQSPDLRWSASWGSAQEQPYGTEVLPQGTLDGSTLRQIVHLSTGGTQLRVTLSNLFGAQPLIVNAVHIARGASTAEGGAIDVTSDRALSFGGRHNATVPMGAEYISDPIVYPTQSLADLVITMQIDHAPQVLTLHAGARATSYILQGSHVDTSDVSSAKRIYRWYFLSSVDVQPAHAADIQDTLIAFGDSITDGHGATTDANDRWTDDLARRLAATAATRQVGVVNAGIGGNRLLEDGIATDGLARFDRDVLERAGVRSVILLEGINDIGVFGRTAEQPQAAHDALVEQMEIALQQMVTRAHTRGVRIFGGTLTPFVGNVYYHPDSRSEADRTRLNEWIRHSGVFDAVIDFDAALRDPAHPDHLLAAWDSGDHLHPGPAGYQRMADAIPLALIPRPGMQ